MAWNASLAEGKVIDGKVGFGVIEELLWHDLANQKRINDTTLHILSDQRTFMFPISGFAFFTPAPQWVVSPSIWGQVGWNNMTFSERDSTGKSTTTWFMGLIVKGAIDAQIKLSENTSLFVGGEYRWSDVNKVGTASSSTVVHHDI